MSIAEVKTSADQKMLKAIESLKTSLSRIRTGRAHIGILDHIHVDYYGSSVPIGQVANITLIDARTLGVAVWEKKLATTVENRCRRVFTDPQRDADADCREKLREPGLQLTVP